MNTKTVRESTREDRIKFVAGVPVCLAFGELRIESFGSASHVAVTYPVASDRGNRWEYGWLPFPLWQATQFSDKTFFDAVI